MTSQEAITTRIPGDTARAIEKFAEIDQTDRSTEIRRLLEMGLFERAKKEVIEKYKVSKISTEGAARELGITIWEVLEMFKKEKVEAQYDMEDFERDINAIT